MDFEASIDEIIKQDQREIKTYWLLAIIVIVIFLTLFCWNLVMSERKDLVANATNMLTLAAGYIPIQQIIKRKKRIIYLDKIVRIELSRDGTNRQALEEMIISIIKKICQI